MSEPMRRLQTIRHADLPAPIRSARDFANAMNCDLSRVAKTILLVADALTWQGQRRVQHPCVCVVLSSPSKIDLQAVSEFLHAEKLRLATADEVDARLGVRPGAVSPLDAGDIPILIDAGLLQHDTIFVSDGRPAIDVEIDPQDLAAISSACQGRFAQSGA